VVAAATTQPPQLAQATTAFLRRYAPFNEMDEASLASVAARAKLGYYPQGAAAAGPHDGVAQRLFIIQRGHVRARVPAGGPDPAAFEFAPGEMFPLNAVLGGRPTTRLYEAIEDLFCYELDAADVQVLLGSSPPFQRFCARNIGSLLEQERRALRAAYAAQAVSDRPLLQPLSSAIRRAPVTCGPGTPLRAALERMHAQRIGAILVVDAEGAPQGIFTERDLVRHAATGRLALEGPISAYMTPDPISLPATATLYEAALVMARHGVRHLLVCDGRKLVGVVSERSLFALQRQSMREVVAVIEVAHDLESLRRAAAEIRALARGMLAQGVSAEPLTQLIATLNDRLGERILTLEAARHDLAGIRFCWLALGSEGRHEQTFASDQDNAIVFDADGSADAARARLLPFADAVNVTLDACGFPLCKGDIMARNPRWCLAAAEWRMRFGEWIRNPHPEALLNANIFFDFRPLWGEAALAVDLRGWLSAVTHDDQRFLRMMAQNALESRPPLGFFGDVRTSGEGVEAGTIDLKAQGTRIFTDAGRIFALATGADVQNTAARLRHAGAVRRVAAEETEAVVDAFYFLVLLRLRHEHLDSPDGPRKPRIDPRTLNELDRRILKEALRLATKVQQRLALDFQL
jgi:CBS domain-containing protein